MLSFLVHTLSSELQCPSVAFEIKLSKNQRPRLQGLHQTEY